MAAGATVGSIYGQMILDTSQYEAALREIVGLTSKGGKNIEKSIDGMSERLDVLEGKADKNKKSIGALTQSLTALGGVLGASAIVGGIKGIIDEGSKFETIRTSFNVMMGDVKKGEKVLQDLNKYSVVTPFTPEQVMRAGKTLLAFNIDAQKLMPTMKMLGDISSGTGKDLTELAVIFGQISSAGKLMGQDYLQLINAGFNPLQIMSEKTGKSMTQLKKDMEQGKIGIKEVEEAFKAATSEGGIFFEMTKKQSEATKGLESTLDGNIAEIKKNMGEGLLEVFKPVLGILIDMTNGILNFAKESPNTFRALTFMATGAAALLAVFVGGAGLISAFNLILPAIRSMQAAMLAFNLSLGPLGLVIAALGALVIAYQSAQDAKERYEKNKTEVGVTVAQVAYSANPQEFDRGIAQLQKFKKEIDEKGGKVEKTKKQISEMNREIAKTGSTLNDIGKSKGGVGNVQIIKSEDLEKQIKLLEQGKEAAKKAKEEGRKPGSLIPSGTGNDILTLEELITAYRKMEKISSQDLKFQIDFSDAQKAKKAMEELSNLGVRSTSAVVADNKSGAVKTRVEFIAPDGSNLDRKTLRKILEGGQPVSVPVEAKVVSNLDTGMFENLKTAVANSSEVFKAFLQTDVGKYAQASMLITSQAVSAAMQIISGAVQSAQVKFQNLTNQMNFWTAFASKQLDDELKLKQKAWDAEIEGLRQQKEELLRIEQEYNQRRDELKNEEIQKIKQRIQEEYNEKAAALQAETMANIAHQEETLSNNEIAELNKELLSEEHLQHLLDLRQQFADKEAEEISALNSRMSEEDKARAKEKVEKETSLAAQIAAIEQKKADDQKAVEDRKASIARDGARLQWILGKSVFEAQKAATHASIQMQMAQGIIAAATTVALMTQATMGFGFPVALAIGATLAAMTTAAGLQAISVNASTQYPPPPATAFALGGMAEGGTPNKDSVPAMLMPGELVVPKKNFEEVIGAVQTSRESRMAPSFAFQIEAMHFHGIVDAEAVADQIEPIMVQRMKSAVEAML